MNLKTVFKRKKNIQKVDMLSNQIFFLLLLSSLASVSCFKKQLDSRCRSFLFMLHWMPNLDSVPEPCGRSKNQTSECSDSLVWIFRNVHDSSPSAFYSDFMKHLTWAPIFCRLDSDGDGRTNGEELGDPDCVWTKASYSPTFNKPLSHPAICEPVDTKKCLTLNKGFTCPAEELNTEPITTTTTIQHSSTKRTTQKTKETTNSNIQPKNVHIFTFTPDKSPTTKNFTWQDVSCVLLIEMLTNRSCSDVERFLEQPFFLKKFIDCLPHIDNNRINNCNSIVDYLRDKVATSTTGRTTLEVQPNPSQTDTSKEGGNLTFNLHRILRDLKDLEKEERSQWSASVDRLNKLRQIDIDLDRETVNYRSNITEEIRKRTRRLRETLVFQLRKQMEDWSVTDWNELISSMESLLDVVRDYRYNGKKDWFRRLDRDQEMCESKYDLKPNVSSCQEAVGYFEESFLKIATGGKECWSTLVDFTEFVCYPKLFDYSKQLEKLTNLQPMFANESLKVFHFSIIHLPIPSSSQPSIGSRSHPSIGTSSHSYSETASTSQPNLKTSPYPSTNIRIYSSLETSSQSPLKTTSIFQPSLKTSPYSYFETSSQSSLETSLIFQSFLKTSLHPSLETGFHSYFETSSHLSQETPSSTYPSLETSIKSSSENPFSSQPSLEISHHQSVKNGPYSSFETGSNISQETQSNSYPSVATWSQSYLDISSISKPYLGTSSHLSLKSGSHSASETEAYQSLENDSSSTLETGSYRSLETPSTTLPYLSSLLPSLDTSTSYTSLINLFNSLPSLKNSSSFPSLENMSNSSVSQQNSLFILSPDSKLDSTLYPENLSNSIFPPYSDTLSDFSTDMDTSSDIPSVPTIPMMERRDKNDSPKEPRTNGYSGFWGFISNWQTVNAVEMPTPWTSYKSTHSYDEDYDSVDVIDNVNENVTSDGGESLLESAGLTRITGGSSKSTSELQTTSTNMNFSILMEILTARTTMDNLNATNELVVKSVESFGLRVQSNYNDFYSIIFLAVIYICYFS